MIHRRVALFAASMVIVPTLALAQAKPAFDCAKATHEIETLICQDEPLAKLDRQLAEVYAAALMALDDVADKVAAQNELKTYQRGWVGGRNECWKEEDKRQCAFDAYTRRIAELQARYFLVKAGEPVFFMCDGNPANEVVATFMESNPPSGRFERGDTTFIAVETPSASGSRYVGDFGFEFWTKGDEAKISTPDPNREELTCEVRR